MDRSDGHRLAALWAIGTARRQNLRGQDRSGGRGIRAQQAGRIVRTATGEGVAGGVQFDPALWPQGHSGLRLDHANQGGEEPGWVDGSCR